MLTIEGLSFTFAGAQRPALDGIDLQVSPGELVLLAGPTGCGKSTLLRLAAGLLPRYRPGRREGTVQVGGAEVLSLSPAARAQRLAFVSQIPGDQLVTHSLGAEVAFAARIAGLRGEALAARVSAGLRQVGLPDEPARSTRALSGGQQQRLAVAAALSAGAPLLLLDEPLASLDPGGARALLLHLRALCDQGLAILMVEHRIELVLPVASRCLGLVNGRACPAPLRFSRSGVRQPRDPGPPLLRLTDARFAHPGEADRAYAIDGVTLEVRAGERIALVGANGAGKSTLLRLLGEAARAGKVSAVAIPQDPDLALFCDTVEAELAFAPTERRLADREARVGAALRALDLVPLAAEAPQSLSRGQRLRVAVAGALTAGPRLLLLDEPTAGQDLPQVDAMMVALDGALGEDTLVFATHDLDLALRMASRIVLLAEGRVRADGPPAALQAALAADPSLGAAS